MIGSVLVGIAIRFTSNGVLTMERLAGATATANASLNEQTAAIARNDAMMRRMRGMIAGALAIGGAAAIVASIAAAAKLQLAMVNVAAATGASTEEFAKMQRMVIQTSGITAQSASTIAAEMAAASSSGLNQPSRLMRAFPTLAKAADVLMFGPKHLDPTDSITQLSKLSHLFGEYSGKPFLDMVDAAVRLMYVQPENLQKLINQGRMFIPMAKAAHVSDHDIFTEAMTLGQTGLLTGRGGAGWARFMQYMLGSPTITEYRSKQQLAGMKALQIYDSHGRNRFINAKGELEQEQAIDWIGHMAKTMKPSDFVVAIQKAFLQQGAYYALAATRPNVMAQRALNTQAFERIAPPGEAVETLWKRYKNTLSFAFRDFWTNVQNVMMGVFTPTLPMFTKFFNGAAAALGKVSDWLFSHPQLSFDIAIAAMAAVISMARYAASQLYNLSGAIAFLGTAARRGGIPIIGPGGAVLGGRLAGEAGVAAEEAPLFSRMATGFLKIIDQVFLFGLGSLALGKLSAIWRPIAGAIETLAIRAIMLPGILGRIASGFLGLSGALRLVLGPIGAVLALLDNARGSDTSGRLSLTELTGPGHTPRDVRDYVHRMGWANVSPDIREYSRNMQRTTGPAASFIRAGRQATPLTGGQAFDQDVLRRALATEAANPIVRSLTGGSSGRSVSDAVTYGSQASSDKVVAAVNNMGHQIVAALAGLGINITVPGVPGQPARTWHETLGRPNAPVARGFAGAPFAAQRLGLGYKP